MKINENYIKKDMGILKIPMSLELFKKEFCISNQEFNQAISHMYDDILTFVSDDFYSISIQIWNDNVLSIYDNDSYYENKMNKVSDSDRFLNFITELQDELTIIINKLEKFIDE